MVTAQEIQEYAIGQRVGIVYKIGGTHRNGFVEGYMASINRDFIQISEEPEDRTKSLMGKNGKHSHFRLDEIVSINSLPKPLKQ